MTCSGESQTTPFIEFGVAFSTIPGESVSGDLHLVKTFSDGVLVAAVDGLGHGDEAAIAAKMAVATMEQHAKESVVSLVNLCHTALLRTRGVVMTVALLDGRQEALTWLGVGNVEGTLLREDAGANTARESVLLRGGVVGYQLPPLRPSVFPLVPQDTLILATDGIESGFAGGLKLSDPPQKIADHILAKHYKGTDDALVLVVRYLGGGR
jgi:serine/threonine protein phosphatase PrpC